MFVKMELDRPWGTALFMAMASSMSLNFITYRIGTNSSVLMISADASISTTVGSTK